MKHAEEIRRRAKDGSSLARQLEAVADAVGILESAMLALERRLLQEAPHGGGEQ